MPTQLEHDQSKWTIYKAIKNTLTSEIAFSWGKWSLLVKQKKEKQTQKQKIKNKQTQFFNKERDKLHILSENDSLQASLYKVGHLSHTSCYTAILSLLMIVFKKLYII